MAFAVTEVNLVTTTADFRLESKNQQQLNYRIVLDPAQDNAQAAQVYLPAQLLGLPSVYSLYAFDDSVICTSVRITPQQGSNSYRFDAICTFGPPPPGTEQDDDLPPTQRQQREFLTWQVETESINTDINGNALVNGLGEPLLDPVFQEWHIPVLNIRKNYATLQEVIDLNDVYQNTVNDDEWRGYAAGKVRFLQAECSQAEFVQNERYYPTIIQLGIRQTIEGWQLRRPDQGFTAKVPGQTEEVANEDDNGQQIAQRAGLNAAGEKEKDPAQVVYKNYTIYKPVDYEVFNSL